VPITKPRLRSENPIIDAVYEIYEGKRRQTIFKKTNRSIRLIAISIMIVNQIKKNMSPLKASAHKRFYREIIIVCLFMCNPQAFAQELSNKNSITYHDPTMQDSFKGEMHIEMINPDGSKSASVLLPSIYLNSILN
jgi:hypothetical protein